MDWSIYGASLAYISLATIDCKGSSYSHLNLQSFTSKDYTHALMIKIFHNRS